MRVYFYVSVYMCVQGAPYVCVSMGGACTCLYVHECMSLYAQAWFCASPDVYTWMGKEMCVYL